MEKELENKIYTLDGATAKNEGVKFTFQVDKYISMGNDDSDDSGSNNPRRTVTFAADDDDSRRGRRNNPPARDRESMGINSELGLMDDFDL